jgi:hypothetical protein
MAIRAGSDSEQPELMKWDVFSEERLVQTTNREEEGSSVNSEAGPRACL